MSEITNRGYSLVELLIVITLLAFLALLTMPSIGLFKRSALRAEVEKLRMLSMYLHRCALATAHEQALIFNTKERSYSYNQVTHALPGDICFGVIPHAYGPPTAPKNPITQAVTFRENTLRCSPHGSLSAGTVYLTDSERSCLYALTIPTGSVPYVRIYRLEGGGASSTWVRIP